VSAKEKSVLQRYLTVYNRRLNEIHIETQVTCSALRVYLDSLDKTKGHNEKTYHHFAVPSGNKPVARVRRERHDLEILLNTAVNQGAHKKSLVLAVSITEDYLANLIKLILRAHPDRITRGVKGGDGKVSILLEDFVGRSREGIIEDLINSRIASALYAKPAEYLSYLGNILEIKVPDAVAAQFIEVKATRDIVVHGDGRANERYVEKSGDFARCAVGQSLIIDQQYFDRAFGVMKGLIHGLHEPVCEKYALDKEVQRFAGRFLE
jgi:hypothetical protein